MGSKYVDVTACVHVVGNIYHNPSLLDKYTVNQEDLPTELHQVIFGAVHNLYQLGVQAIDIPTIEDYLESRPKKAAIYKVQRGRDWLTKVVDFINPLTFEYYYKRMKKFTLLRAYSQVGVDCSDIYDVDNILDAKKKQEQEDWLDNTPLEQIADAVNGKIEVIKAKYAENVNDTFSQAGEGADDLISSLMENPEVGYPLYGDLNNAVTRGARLGKLYLRSAATGVGKAIPDDTFLPTPIGVRQVRDIQPGDYLFDAWGRPTQVLGVYPQGKKQVYKITFDDGRVAYCCGDHLWSYRPLSYYREQEGTHGREHYRDTYIREFYTATAQELYEEMQEGKTDFCIPLSAAVQYKTQNYVIDPYSMGYLLACGKLPIFDDNIGYAARNWVKLKKYYPEFFKSKKRKRELPLEYYYGDVKQRWDLFNGFLDARILLKRIENGSLTFSSRSHEGFIDTVIAIARSLGVKVLTKENEKGAYKVTFKIPYRDRLKVFRQTNKKRRYRKRLDEKQAQTNFSSKIVSIEKLDKKEDMTCFFVNNAEHLFLMNDYIVTHNTRAMIADVCTIGSKEFYKDGEWKSNAAAEPTIFITTEQQVDEIQTMMLAFVSDVNEDHIIDNRYEEGELERVRYAAKVLTNSPIQIKRLPDFGLQDIENTIKYGIREFGARYIFFDYIHSSMKILSEVSGKAGVKGLREDNVLFMIAVRLKDLCVENNVFIQTSTQLNGDYRDAKVYDQNLLRGAKSIADKIDLGSIMLGVSQEDLESLKTLIEQNGLPLPDTKISIYKNRRGRHKDILLWCTSNRATCKITPLFATNYYYEFLDIKPLKIQVTKEETT